MSGTVKALQGLAPWTDRRGRLHPLRLTVFLLLLLPGAWLAVRWQAGLLGARPLNALIHGTGYWAVWTLLAALCVTPVKALMGRPDLVVLRRMIGNASLAYAAIHLLLYVTDQNWRLLTVVTEIATRIYLLIGFVALLGLGVLGWTSSDTWVKRLGRGWKRLHKWVYGLGVLAAVHFFLQSKADVSAATVAAGVFIWLMLWRTLPAGRDRGPLPLLGLAVVAALATLAVEFAWYRFGTKIDPMRVLRGEFDLTYGVHAAGLVLVLGLAAAALLEVRSLGQGRLGQGQGFTIAVYAAGALLFPAVCAVLGWGWEDAVPDGVTLAWLLPPWVLLFALLGLGRHWVRATWQRHAVDAFWGAAALSPFVLLGVVPLPGTEQQGVLIGCAAAALAAAALLALRVWPVSRGAALLVLPLAAGIAAGAVSLLELA